MTTTPTGHDLARLMKAALQCGDVFLHLDPRRQGVMVPVNFRANHKLVLQFGYDMPVRIPDLIISDEGVSGTLSFNRNAEWVFVPWSVVYAMTDAGGDGCMWVER